jgi:hypothetical protein
MRRSHFLILMGLGLAPLAFGAAFPMPKPGEWRVKDLTASAPATKGADPSTLECIEAQDKKRWEEDFKKAASESGMDCQLKLKTETGTQLAYDIQCKGRRPASGSASVHVYSQDAQGSLIWNRQSETSYTIEQEIKLLGMKAEGVDPAKVSAKEKRMMDAAMRHTPESSTTRIKNEYTFVGPKCTNGVTSPKKK